MWRVSAWSVDLSVEGALSDFSELILHSMDEFLSMSIMHMYMYVYILPFSITHLDSLIPFIMLQTLDISNNSIYGK